jgi:hypothetical protein
MIFTTKSVARFGLTSFYVSFRFDHREQIPPAELSQQSSMGKFNLLFPFIRLIEVQRLSSTAIFERQSRR